jgi:putative heme-binding domain-containing protein
VKGKDGHEVEMQSGNTFRFRPDGSRLEVYTRGQVNPFGIAVDPWFNLYTADCHSKPITQLIPGAYYQSFGKPNDGLGYAPHVVHHDHGSTALCGLSWYDANQFPSEYKGTMFLGIGHYEVDLKHPERDKDRGRIWRIVWKGKDGMAPTPTPLYQDLTTASPVQLVGMFEMGSTASRLLILQELIVRLKKSPKFYTQMKDTLKGYSDSTFKQVPLIFWGLFWAQTDKTPLSFGSLLEDSTKVKSGTDESQAYSLVHLLRMATAVPDWGKVNGLTAGVSARISDASPKVQMAAVEAVTYHPKGDFVSPLVQLIQKCPAEDTHLLQAARIALRNCLRDDEKSWPEAVTKENRDIYLDVALAIPSKRAADFLLTQLKTGTLNANRLAPLVEHITRQGVTEATLGQLATLLTTQYPASVSPDAFLAMFRALQSRGERLGTESITVVMSAMQGEILSMQDGADLPKRQLAAIRVLTALPTVVVKSPELPTLDGAALKKLTGFIGDLKTPLDLRTASADVLLRYNSGEALTAVRGQLAKTGTAEGVRAAFLTVLATSGTPEGRHDARDSLKDVPYRLAVSIGTALASTPDGAQDLLEAIKQGKAPARLLQERALVERLRGARVPDLDKQIADLTKGMPAVDQRIAQLMKQRATTFTSAKKDKEAGAKLFVKHCGACHRIADEGGKIAPQLDGIGTRGLERLLEDVLDPNRNVDQAFRARVITTKDDRTITGLLLRTEGEVLILADAEGKEVRIPTKDIESNRETLLSPMPANFGEVIPEADFYSLMAYLLDQKAPEKK